MWRCVSRIDYGTKYCRSSPTLDERPLQAAILSAINAAMSRKDALVGQIADAMRMELAPASDGTMSISEIDRHMAELNREFRELFDTSKAGDGYLKHVDAFKQISDWMSALKEQKTLLLERQDSSSAADQRIADAVNILNAGSVELTEWEESTIYQLVDTVKVLSADRIRVYLHGGMEIEQSIQRGMTL